MPAGPGEALLATLFADVHYYFSDPSSRPPHHRFNKGSYVYLFHNATQGQAKVEIANNAGTPHQDAFYGYLNVAYVRYSYLQPTLCTLFINTGAVPDQSTWHLPALDLKNEHKSMYKLHALDIYLWTEKDASTFLGHLKTVLNTSQLDIKNAPNVVGPASPHAEHRDSMSPVVQQLERTAIDSQIPPRAISTVSAHSIPGPPTSAGPGAASPAVTPMAYNPAAPPAPEPVQYREKTPPPDDNTGTGLAVAAKYDSIPHTQHTAGPGTMYQSSAQTTPQHAYSFSGPPQQPRQPSQTGFSGPPQVASHESAPRTYSGGVPSPPQQQRAPSFGPMAQSTLPQSPPPHQQSFHQQSSYGGPGQTQYASYNPQSTNQPGTPGFHSQLPPTPSAPPSYSGPPGMQSPGLPPPPPPQQQHVPPGGYNNYTYHTAQAPQSGDMNATGAYVGDLHNQAYRPTQEESHSYSKPQRQSQALAGQGKPTAVSKVEGNVNKYLKKLDKLW